MAIEVRVSWESVADGKTAQGGNFKYLMQLLISDGYKLVINDDHSGKDPKSFENADDFGKWFDGYQK